MTRKNRRYKRPSKPPVGERQVKVFLDEPAPTFDCLKCPIDRNQHEDIRKGDREQKQRRDDRAGHGPKGLEGVELVLQSRRRDRDGERQRNHDRRMTEREE